MKKMAKLNRVVYIGYGIYSFVPLIDMTLERKETKYPFKPDMTIHQK